MSFFSELKQNVIVSAVNSSTANLGGGATFTGTGDSTLGVNAIQVNVSADQNLRVHVDQSLDNVNWDISDTFNYYSSATGSSWTIQATASYFRVRVTNLNPTVATTHLRLQSVLCPIVEALPRSLSDEGYLKVGVYEIENDVGNRVEITPGGELLTQAPTRMCGGPFPGTVLDANFWTTTIVGSGAAAVASGYITLSTGATSASSIIVNTIRVSRFDFAHTNKWSGTIIAPAVVGANTRRWGAFDANNGYYFKHDGTTLSVCSRKATVETAVASGSFNGKNGLTYVLDTSPHYYEITYTTVGVLFEIDGILIHSIAGASSLVTDGSLKVGLECTNGANINNNTLICLGATGMRMGPLHGNAHYKNIAGAGTNTLKSSAGHLVRVILNSGSGTSATIYDNTSATGTIIGTLNLGGSSSPVTLDYDCPFNIGLTVVTVGASANITVVYE